jgi:flagellar biosynthesis chaperone FliJ
MKGLATLIKLSKRTLDELRRKMAALEKEKSDLEFAVITLQEELQREIAMAEKQPDMAQFFGDFAKRIQNRQQQLAVEIKSVDKKIEMLREEITVAFGELKKYEIALENDRRRKLEEQNRKDTIVLDEIAGQQHRRKQEN